MKGTHGFEPWTYRTAADCSTTELYPQALKRQCSGVASTYTHKSQSTLVAILPSFLNRMLTFVLMERGGVGGIMVSIAAFQAVDPGSIPGRRIILV